jgi:iron complex transport system ATP-binding protein
MPQERDIAWAVDVRSLVALGRLPHRPAFAAPTRADQDAIDRALTETDTQLLSHRPAPELSGGERARVLIARALAQEAPLLVADEPTSGLDPAQQLTLLTLFRRMAKDGAAIILSMHDLQLAARFADRICLLNAGRSTALGPPRDVLTRANIQAVYGCDTLITETPAGLSFVPMLPNDGS